MYRLPIVPLAFHSPQLSERVSVWLTLIWDIAFGEAIPGTRQLHIKPPVSVFKPMHGAYRVINRLLFMCYPEPVLLNLDDPAGSGLMSIVN